MPTGSSVIGQVMVGLTQMHGAAAAIDPVNILLGSGVQWLSAALYMFAACAGAIGRLGEYSVQSLQ